jgi:hypothetical protein
MPVKKKGVGKRGKDKKQRKSPVKNVPLVRDYEYWEEFLGMVEDELKEYLKTDKVKNYVKTNSRLSVEEFVKKGMKYFRFAIKHNRGFTVSGLSLFLGISSDQILRMEQKSSVNEVNYVSDVYKKPAEMFRGLIGLFHEEMGNKKNNPIFNMFLLKAMRGGFEEKLDLNVNPTGARMPEEERFKLRDKVKQFTERDVTAIAGKSKIKYGKNT